MERVMNWSCWSRAESSAQGLFSAQSGGEAGGRDQDSMGEAGSRVHESGSRMSRFGQGWPGGRHEAEKSWFSPINKALKLSKCLYPPEGPGLYAHPPGLLRQDRATAQASLLSRRNSHLQLLSSQKASSAKAYYRAVFMLLG